MEGYKDSKKLLQTKEIYEKLKDGKPIHITNLLKKNDPKKTLDYIEQLNYARQNGFDIETLQLGRYIQAQRVDLDSKLIPKEDFWNTILELFQEHNIPQNVITQKFIKEKRDKMTLNVEFYDESLFENGILTIEAKNTFYLILKLSSLLNK